MFRMLEVSAAGMQVEMARVNTIATNMANIHSAYEPNGTGFVPKKLVSAVRAASFDSQFDAEYRAQALATTELKEYPVATRSVHEPSHPFADKDGNVRYPNVTPLEEMLGLMEASRAYESNIQAFNMAKSMVQKALQIGFVR